jgi:predicted TIM-barrel fold metal-dependent hydrolase
MKMDSSKIYENIKETVYSTRLFDTHEHLPQEAERLKNRPDPYQTLLSGYVSSDLISSGMSQEELEKISDPTVNSKKRWDILKPYWDSIQNTGYTWALNISIRELYGVEGLEIKTYDKLAEKMDMRNKVGLYSWVLKEKSGIECSILDTSHNNVPVETVDRNFFSPVMRFIHFIMIKNRHDLEEIGNRCHINIHSLSDIITALEREFDRATANIVGVKLGEAYMRRIRYDKVTFREAEEVFNNIYRSESFERVVKDGEGSYIPASLSMREAEPLQNFIVHKIIQFAAERSLPIQIHTGLHAGNENVLTNSNPMLLVNLFREYKEARFDIFHGSYPYTDELAALAKNFPNVYVDMCWLHIISPHRARLALSEWLDTVPSNKIFGFGGDYAFVEGVYGHSIIARDNITRVLTDKVEEGIFTLEQSLILAKKLVRYNAEEFFAKQG